MAETFYLATGKRKSSIARVRLKTGSGKIIVNGKSALDYFHRESALPFVEQPLELTENTDKIDVYANIRGGGLSGQAGALRHGISRALIEMNPELRPVLKRAGLITRDSRVKERKKYGLAAARRAYQFSKR
ncbi:MAG: 30S ribosomal protein S9 [Candidatus Latescibacteria bacterium]|nr:30S ribosomal protein S9 [Candidatus Latescibacterota bacterium]